MIPSNLANHSFLYNFDFPGHRSMHHNVLLVAAGLFCSPIFAAPNANNVRGMEIWKNPRHKSIY